MKCKIWHSSAYLTSATDHCSFPRQIAPRFYRGKKKLHTSVARDHYTWQRRGIASSRGVNTFRRCCTNSLRIFNFTTYFLGEKGRLLARFLENVKPTNGKSFPLNPFPSCDKPLYFSKWMIGSGLSGSNSSKWDVSVAPSKLGTYGGTANQQHKKRHASIFEGYAKQAQSISRKSKKILNCNYLWLPTPSATRQFAPWTQLCSNIKSRQLLQTFRYNAVLYNQL